MQYPFGVLTKIRLIVLRKFRGRQPAGPAGSNVEEMLYELEWPSLDSVKDRSSQDSL